MNISDFRFFGKFDLMPFSIFMDSSRLKTRFYKKSTFVTHLPEIYLYSPTHYWLHQVEESRWRVGVTKFSTRMLGNLVDFGIETSSESAIKPGQIIGWIEGFKAISDIYCVGEGKMVGVNKELESNMEAGWKDNYKSGWLYEFFGKPDSRCMPVDEYVSILDTTIEKILEQQRKAGELDDESTTS